MEISVLYSDNICLHFLIHLFVQSIFRTRCYSRNQGYSNEQDILSTFTKFTVLRGILAINFICARVKSNPSKPIRLKQLRRGPNLRDQGGLGFSEEAVVFLVQLSQVFLKLLDNNHLGICFYYSISKLLLLEILTE